MNVTKELHPTGEIKVTDVGNDRNTKSARIKMLHQNAKIWLQNDSILHKNTTFLRKLALI